MTKQRRGHRIADQCSGETSSPRRNDAIFHSAGWIFDQSKSVGFRIYLQTFRLFPRVGLSHVLCPKIPLSVSRIPGSVSTYTTQEEFHYKRPPRYVSVYNSSGRQLRNCWTANPPIGTIITLTTRGRVGRNAASTRRCRRGAAAGLRWRG